MKHKTSKKLISGVVGITFLLAGLWLVSPYVKEVSADAWFAADAHVINAYLNGCYYYDPPKAPTSIQILLHGGGNFDGATNFQWDCDNDGVYEGSGAGTKSGSYNPGDGTIVVEWWNGWSFGRHSWNVYGGGEWQYWYGRDISCSYSTGGQKRVNVIAERGGRVSSSSTTFNIQELTFNFSLGIPANGDYKPPYDDRANTGVYEVGTPAPTNIDLGIGMRENGARYQNDGSYSGFDTRGFTYEVDCNGDGKFDEKSGSSNNSSFYIFPGYPPRWNGATFADNICYFQKPGSYQIGIKVKDPAGKEHTLTQGVYLRSNEPFTVNVWPTGKTSGAASYVFSGLQDVKFSLKVTGLTSINTGSYNTIIDCGNGELISGPGANGRNYPEGVLTADNIGPCHYSKPGIYEVKAKFQEYKPASESFPAKGGESDKIKGIITNESNVVSPFNLKWDVTNANTCSIKGPEGGFSAAGLPASGTKTGIKAPVGTYEYTLTCTSSGGLSTERIIKVNVMGAL